MNTLQLVQFDTVGAEMKGSHTCMPNVTGDQIKFYAVEIVEFFEEGEKKRRKYLGSAW